jgi:hypothetical protein
MGLKDELVMFVLGEGIEQIVFTYSMSSFEFSPLVDGAIVNFDTLFDDPNMIGNYRIVKYLGREPNIGNKFKIEKI